jgi:hypothetical protein
MATSSLDLKMAGRFDHRVWARARLNTWSISLSPGRPGWRPVWPQQTRQSHVETVVAP